MFDFELSKLILITTLAVFLISPKEFPMIIRMVIKQVMVIKAYFRELVREVTLETKPQKHNIPL